jgi:hypothetical protein
MNKVFYFIFYFIVYFQSIHAENNPIIILHFNSNCWADTNPFEASYIHENFNIEIENESVLNVTNIQKVITLISDNNQFVMENTKEYASYYGNQPIGIFDKNEIEKIAKSKSLKLLVEYKTIVKKKVKIFDLGMDSFFNRKTGMVEIHKKQDKYEYRNETIDKKDYYPVKIDNKEIENVITKCQVSVKADKGLKHTKEIWIIIGSIVGVLILFLIIRTLYQQAKKVYKGTSKRIHAYRVQKISEDEAIRTTVNKAIMENDDEYTKLQNLINNAVAKGDTETAKALLEILEKQKK